MHGGIVNGEKVYLAAAVTGVLVGVLNMMVRALPGLATCPHCQVLVVFILYKSMCTALRFVVK